jgi:hypothetical protein
MSVAEKVNTGELLLPVLAASRLEEDLAPTEVSNRNYLTEIELRGALDAGILHDVAKANGTHEKTLSAIVGKLGWGCEKVRGGSDRRYTLKTSSGAECELRYSDSGVTLKLNAAYEDPYVQKEKDPSKIFPDNKVLMSGSSIRSDDPRDFNHSSPFAAFEGLRNEEVGYWAAVAGLTASRGKWRSLGHLAFRETMTFEYLPESKNHGNATLDKELSGVRTLLTVRPSGDDLQLTLEFSVSRNKASGYVHRSHLSGGVL